MSVCEPLLEYPASASEYLTNLDCSNLNFGDINGDTVINIQDIILMVNLVLGGEYNVLADINTDGTVDVLDVVQIINIILN